MTPWTGEADAKPSTEFTLTSAPGGAGPCAKTLAERPFAPKFEARGTNPQAGAYTDVNLNVVRDPGSQELKGADVKLPPGLTAKLAGVRYCPEEAIAAAAANSGVAEAATPSCPPESLVGVASITSGSGPKPLQIETGKAFLAGPYHGAPLSLAVITPATAGPFDLGTVVVRVALFLDPKTARVTAVTDPIPHIYGGALLDIRSVSVKVNRPQFSLNPTNCSPSAFEGTLRGGGANPADPAAFTLVRRHEPVPGQRLREPRLQAEAVPAHLRRDEADQETQTEGDPRRPSRRRQHLTGGRHPAESRSSSNRRTSPTSAPGCSSRPTNARRTRSTASPKRRPRCSTAR